MEFFRLIRLLAGKESDKCGLIGTLFYREVRPDASRNLGGRQITEPLIASPGCAAIGLSSITLSLPCGKQKRQNPAEWSTGRESLAICAMPGLVGAVHPRVIRL